MNLLNQLVFLWQYFLRKFPLFTFASLAAVVLVMISAQSFDKQGLEALLHMVTGFVVWTVACLFRAVIYWFSVFAAEVEAALEEERQQAEEMDDIYGLKSDKTDSENN